MITREPFPPSALLHEDWRERNALGILQARSSSWDEAVLLFEQAHDAMRVDESDDARAVLSSNLATARFFAGDPDAALADAHRSLAIRERLWGDTLATARARSDVATICCALGRHSDAVALLASVIASVESQCGHEAHELVPFLENAARAAIASGDLATAEPLVLRLHGLLDSHEYPTQVADALYAIVAEGRGGFGAAEEFGTHTTIDGVDASTTNATFDSADAATGHAILAIGDASATNTEAQSTQRNAEQFGEVETCVPVLPSGGSADERVLLAQDRAEIVEQSTDVEASGSAANEDVVQAPEPEAHSHDPVGGGLEPVVEAQDEPAAESSDDVVTEASSPDHVLLSAAIALEIPDETPAFDLADSFTDLELVEPPPPTLDRVPEHRRHVHRDDEALGFLVQHGTSVTPDTPVNVLDGPIGPLPELAPHPALLVRIAEPSPAAAALPTPAPSLAQTRGVQVRRASRDVPVVMPSPSRALVAIPEFEDVDNSVAPRNALHLPGAAAIARVANDASTQVLLDRPRIRASGGARVWLVVGGGLATLVAAIAWYMVQNVR